MLVALGALGGAAAEGSAQTMGFPSGLALAPSGAEVTVADRRTHQVYDVDLATGERTLVAGTGRAGFSGDGGPAIEADLRNPEWVDYDSDGNLLVADRGNGRVRRIDRTTGLITTVAGTGDFAYEGDGGAAVDASLTAPFGVLDGPDGHVYVFDTEAHVVRRIDSSTGVITTVLGDGTRGFAGDGGHGTAARLARPHNGVFDRNGRLVFGDSFNQRIRVWDPAHDIVRTLAGSGREGAPDPGMPASASPFQYFGGLVVEPDGRIVFTSLDHRILRLDVASDRLEVVAGLGERGFSGDGGPATAARLNSPYGLVRTPDGDLLVADAGNARIRRIDARTGRVVTVSGGQ